jgi:hypothetical protein
MGSAQLLLLTLTHVMSLSHRWGSSMASTMSWREQSQGTLLWSRPGKLIEPVTLCSGGDGWFFNNNHKNVLYSNSTRGQHFLAWCCATACANIQNQLQRTTTATVNDYIVNALTLLSISAYNKQFMILSLSFYRKTARNFNQPMCKAAKVTVVEVSMSMNQFQLTACSTIMCGLRVYRTLHQTFIPNLRLRLLLP